MSQIYENAKFLKLPFIKDNFEDELTRARLNNLDLETFLDDLLIKEVKNRNERSIQNRLKQAKLPYQMTFDSFQTDHLSKSVRERIEKLASLEFIDRKENVLLIGNPGVGKTALAVTLATKACLNHKSVLFVNVSDLILQIGESLSQNQLMRYKRRFENYDLVVLDELGFVSFDHESGEILFNLLSGRNDKGSMIVTSNLSVDRWIEVFHDPMLTTAMVDRLADRSHLIDMTGKSYRVLRTKQWQKEN